MRKEVMLVTGAGQISMAVARRIGHGKKIILGDKKVENANAIAKVMNEAGFDVVPFEMDLSSRESILEIIAEARKYGEIRYLVNGAGVSPSQAPIEVILKVDLYGTAVLLEEVGKVIVEGGCGVTISSQSGWPRRTACWQPRPQKNCFHWIFCSQRTSAIPCMRISWLSAAMKNGSWQNASTGESAEHVSMISLPGSS